MATTMALGCELTVLFVKTVIKPIQAILLMFHKI